jgi:hypothetical protein
MIDQKNVRLRVIILYKRVRREGEGNCLEIVSAWQSCRG